MNGWLYLIKNGNLYKIGITRHFDNRMRQLKPDNVVVKLYSSEFKLLEREFHKRYKNVRIPQTEYFRLDHRQIRQIKRRIRKFYYPKRMTLDIFMSSMSLLLLLFSFVFLYKFLFINDIPHVLLRSFQWMEFISFGLSFFSLFIKSNRYLSAFNELKFRLSRFCIFVLFAYLFRYISLYLF